jgi:hypothetical protein
LSEYQEDGIEDSSDLNEEEINDEVAESSAALDDDEQEDDDQETDGAETAEQSDLVAEETDEEVLRKVNSDKANERFSKITAENKELKRRLDAVETVPEYKDPGAPKEADYPDYDSHQAALIEYGAEKSTYKVLSERQETYRQAQEQAQKQALYGDHDQKQKQLATTMTDLWKTLDGSYLDNRTAGGNATAEAILRRDNGAEIEYFIAKNPEVAVRLNGSDQYSVFDEISRISESLRVKPKKSAALPKPVGASPSGGGRTSEHKAVFSAGATFE